MVNGKGADQPALSVRSEFVLRESGRRDEEFCVLNLKIETLVLKKHLSYVSKISSTIIRSSAILSCIFKIINRHVRHQKLTSLTTSFYKE